MSADRFKQAAKANDSGSWNKYAYAQGDPVNRIDFSGKQSKTVDECGENEDCDYCDENPDAFACSGDLSGDGGGGGGTTDEGGSGFTPCKDAGCLPEALAAALKDLSKTQCAGLFGTAQTRDGAFNPTAVIQQVYNLSGGTVNGSSVGVVFSIFPSLIGDAAITPGKTVIIGTGSWGAWNQSGAVGDVPTLAGWGFSRNRSPFSSDPDHDSRVIDQ